MFERNVFDEYSLYCDERFTIGAYQGFSCQGKYYFFVPVDRYEDAELLDMMKMGSHLQAAGEPAIATFIPTKTNMMTAFVDGENCVLFEFPLDEGTNPVSSVGQQLAAMHQRGRSYPLSQNKAAVPKWNELWAERLQQLESWYEFILNKNRKSSFDEAFLLSFPYYLGLTENAIQYVVDTEIDIGSRHSQPTNTICFYKFSDKRLLFKQPFEFVYDHPSRDLAEMLRKRGKKYQWNKMRSFLSNYQKDTHIDEYTWRRMYARLLFPISYFQTVEGYYRTQDEVQQDVFQEKLYDIFLQEQQHEQFLRQFHEKLVPQQMNIPQVDWLIKSSS